MIETTFRCNYCPKLRDPEKNHWWLLDIAGTNFHLSPWLDCDAGITGMQHICSDDCVRAALTAHLQRVLNARVAVEQNVAMEARLLAQQYVLAQQLDKPPEKAKA